MFQWRCILYLAAGMGHRTLDGRLFPLSVLNVVDADFALPYDVDDLFRQVERPAPQQSRTVASHRRHAAASKPHVQVLSSREAHAARSCKVSGP